MPIIIKNDGRRFTTVTVNVESDLKERAKAAGINLTQAFSQALEQKLQEVSA